MLLGGKEHNGTSHQPSFHWVYSSLIDDLADLCKTVTSSTKGKKVNSQQHIHTKQDTQNRAKFIYRLLAARLNFI